MNRGLLPEMLHCTDMTVLERQRARLKWEQEPLQQQQQQQQQQQYQHQQPQESYFSELSGAFSLPSQLISQVQQQGFEGGLMGGGDSVMFGGSVKPDPAFASGWPDLGKIMVPTYGFGPCGPGFEVSNAISRTSSCPPAVAPDAVEVKGKESAVPNDKMSAAVGRESLKKRKADKVQSTKVCRVFDVHCPCIKVSIQVLMLQRTQINFAHFFKFFIFYFFSLY